MNGKLPERQAAGAMMCPKCRKMSLQLIEASSELACTNCGFKQPIKKV
jgi:DNA-directed RNA polymerase subunit RPC12/RpoP